MEIFEALTSDIFFLSLNNYSVLINSYYGFVASLIVRFIFVN